MNIYIMIAGMKRTGSTWQANAVRLLYEEVYSPEEVWVGEEYEGVPQNRVTINKIHPYIENLATKATYVLTSYRNLWEVRASWKRFTGRYPTPEQFKRWINSLVMWNLHADHMTHFRILGNPEREKKEIMALAWTLDIDFTEDMIREVHQGLNNISPPKEKDYDKRTLMFKGHLTQERFKNE